jgi:hypothetical protein
MQFVLLIVTLLGLSVAVLASNSGIFNDDGHVDNIFARTPPIEYLCTGGTPTTFGNTRHENLSVIDRHWILCLALVGVLQEIMKL